MFKYISLFLLLFCNSLFAQKNATISGKITDIYGEIIEGVELINTSTKKGATTNNKGIYQITIPAKGFTTINIHHISFKDTIIYVNGEAGILQNINITLNEKIESIDSTVISASKSNKSSEYTLDPKNTIMLPTASGNGIEDLLKTLPGTFSRNELTSQYSVRGGNYDENLVYVNDFEIYRPQLITSSTQEGLSFINPDLVQSISFSTGGFEAKYGDKMSSVLNIKYKRPTEKFAGSATASLLGTHAHLEGITKNEKFSFLLGVRYKTSSYLLGSLDKKGEYNNRFLDIQSNIVAKFNEKTSLEFLFSHNNNKYNFLPSEQSTTTGTFNQVIRLTVFFDGEEKTNYNTTMGGMALRWMPTSRSIIKWTNSGWVLNENEQNNVIGGYFLDEIESDFDNDNFGNVRQNLGIGTYHDWVRNNLSGWIYNSQIKGSHQLGEKHILDWGSTFQTEHFEDKISEWERIDSAGYALPYNNTTVNIAYRLKSSLNLDAWRIQGFVQDSWKLSDKKTKINLTYGLRYHYYNINNQIIISPRTQLYIKPNTKNEVAFKISTGLYAQPPFYRELRALNGQINKNVKAQQSIHIVVGSEVNFKIGKRQFKFTSEAYYKQLKRLNPYEFDDVRIRYFANNNAKGYATGVDVRLFGEFVKGTDSWVSLSYLNTKEDLSDDGFLEYYNAAGEKIMPYIEDQIIADSATIYPGYLRRPSDQHFMMSIFFQDYLVKNKNFKMHLNLQLGTGLPYGAPDGKRYNDLFTMPLYRRVDIGFSWLIIDNEKKNKENLSKFNKVIDKIWLSGEVLNLLGVQNTLSYQWVKDVSNTIWPLPNYLTSRRFNVKLYVKF